jgi:glucose-1-phosphate cytidylyltransferase
MKAVILAGGLGSRISEETHLKPKPMTDIGGKPILWHILKLYSAHGVNEFVICCGYKGYTHQRIFRELLPAHVRCHLRHGQQPDAGASTQG